MNRLAIAATALAFGPAWPAAADAILVYDHFGLRSTIVGICEGVPFSAIQNEEREGGLSIPYFSAGAGVYLPTGGEGNAHGSGALDYAPRSPGLDGVFSSAWIYQFTQLSWYRLYASVSGSIRTEMAYTVDFDLTEATAWSWAGARYAETLEATELRLIDRVTGAVVYGETYNQWGSAALGAGGQLPAGSYRLALTSVTVVPIDGEDHRVEMQVQGTFTVPAPGAVAVIGVAGLKRRIRSSRRARRAT